MLLHRHAIPSFFGQHAFHGACKGTQACATMQTLLYTVEDIHL